MIHYYRFDEGLGFRKSFLLNLSNNTFNFVIVVDPKIVRSILDVPVKVKHTPVKHTKKIENYLLYGFKRGAMYHV